MNRSLFSDFPPLPRLFPRWSHSALLVFGLAVVVRVAAGLLLQGQLSEDPDGYALLARNLAQFHVLGAVYVGTDDEGAPKLVRQPSAYRPPLYPLLLRYTCLRRIPDARLEELRSEAEQPALVATHELSIPRVIILHTLMGVLTTVLVWRLAVRCGLGGWGMVAVAAILVDPILINQASLVMTETLATLLVASSLWFLMRRKEYLDVLQEEEGNGDDDNGSDDDEIDGDSGEIDLDPGSSQEIETLRDEDDVVEERGSYLKRGVRRISSRALRMRWPAVGDEYFWLPLIHLDVLAGLFLGLACLCRPTFLAWVGLIVIVETVRHTYRRHKEGLARLFVMTIAIFVVLSPWIVRNGAQIGKPTPTTTHGGYTLMLGNNPDFYRHLSESPGVVWDATDLDADVRSFISKNQLSEVEADRDAYGRAFNAIAESPRAFLHSCAVRFGRFWSPMPHKLSDNESWPQRVIRWVTAAWYDGVLVLMLLGMTVAIRRRFSGPWLEGFLLMVALTIVHLFFWSNMRMRAPLTPFVALLVALGLVLVFSHDDEVEPVSVGPRSLRRRRRTRQS